MAKSKSKSESKNYTVISSSIGGTGGRYTSASGPAAAAKKAASQRLRGASGNNKVRLTVRQLGSDREFKYEATRVKLAKPVVRKIKGVTITSEYKIEIKAV
jgi:hypothetical protein